MAWRQCHSMTTFWSRFSIRSVGGFLGVKAKEKTKGWVSGTGQESLRPPWSSQAPFWAGMVGPDTPVVLLSAETTREESGLGLRAALGPEGRPSGSISWPHSRGRMEALSLWPPLPCQGSPLFLPCLGSSTSGIPVAPLSGQKLPGLSLWEEPQLPLLRVALGQQRSLLNSSEPQPLPLLVSVLAQCCDPSSPS